MSSYLILIVAGARPNFMKIAPIIRALERHRDAFAWRLVHTGQHYDREMSDVFFEELEIPKPHYHLDAGGGTHAQQTAKIMIGFEDVVQKERPQLVMVVGDVNSTLACSIVAKKLQIQVAHVEAGLRSGDLMMPEEINRIVTDAISDYFFVTEPSGVENLRREGKREEQIFFVGHVMIDNLYHQVKKLQEMDDSAFPTATLKSKLGKYGVVTLHRPSNVDNAERLGGIVEALAQVANHIPLIFAVHPRTAQNLDKFGICLPDSIIRTNPLPYMEFLNLWMDAQVILTDSGGIQEESTALGVPCVTLRENTERPITISEGSNVLVGSDPEKIVAAALKVLSHPGQARTKRPALWDGAASDRIVDELAKLIV
ncbi:MAG: UDP-N-acetylglucosamine 2-epimerase (non-hydrolyzing) [Gammaproteobacteria bacterium]|nr:UDP-N-acetylglucosamine 2-epimerase (non-hydrolyzing) [Gammaproteobacteria bacterium]